MALFCPILAALLDYTPTSAYNIEYESMCVKPWSADASM